MKDSHLLKDIRLGVRHRELRPQYGVARQRRRLPRPRGEGSGSRFYEDFATIEGNGNLAQAVVLRLLTPLGELAELHPDYGSRLPDLVSRRNHETTRNQAKSYILQSLANEPRIAEVLRVEVTSRPEQPDRIDVELEILPAAAPSEETEAETIFIGPLTLRWQS